MKRSDDGTATVGWNSWAIFEAMRDGLSHGSIDRLSLESVWVTAAAAQIDSNSAKHSRPAAGEPEGFPDDPWQNQR